MRLEIDSLSVRYGSRLALDGVSLTVNAGEILTVIGPNGAGKTTLIRAVSGVLPASSGSIRVDGKPVERMDSAARARCIGVVPQARQLPPAFTGWETVALGRTPHLNWLGQLSESDEKIITRAMQRTHTEELANRPVGELSGGEQQRLLLARALAQSAPVLLMDEPTTHLDLQYQLDLLGQVRSLARQDGYTVLSTLHDLNLVARFADRVALLVDGKLRALGTPHEVMTADLLSEVYHVPLQIAGTTSGGFPVITPLIV